MKVEDVVGTRIRAAREALGMSQRELGERLAAYLGRSLFAQAVSAMEQGKRDFVAAELLALAAILKKPPGWFLTTDEPGAVVEFPGGATLNRGQLASLAVLGDAGRQRRRRESERALLQELSEEIGDSLRNALGALNTQSEATQALRALALGAISWEDEQADQGTEGGPK